MYPFTPGSFAPRNGWYVAAFTDEVTRKLLSRWILNQPVVLYRKEDGTAVAIDGRCPHRHFPLGESQLIGDNVRCGYHGISFAPDGRCVRIPSQAAIPAVLRLRTYPVVERGLWLWIWTGDPTQADEKLLPTTEEIGLDTPGLIARSFYSLHVKGRYQLLNDNLLDLSHLGFLHSTSIGSEENASAPEQRDFNERRLRSRRNMYSATAPETLAVLSGGHRGPIERTAGMDFFFPGFHSGMDEAYVPTNAAERAGELLNFAKVWHAVTPSTHDETLYFFGMGAMKEEVLDMAYAMLKPVVAEDVFATEAIEKTLQRIGKLPPELMLKSDSTAVQGRRIMQSMMDRERGVATELNPAGAE